MARKYNAMREWLCKQELKELNGQALPMDDKERYQLCYDIFGISDNDKKYLPIDLLPEDFGFESEEY